MEMIQDHEITYIDTEGRQAQNTHMLYQQCRSDAIDVQRRHFRFILVGCRPAPPCSSSSFSIQTRGAYRLLAFCQSMRDNPLSGHLLE
jgi:hypothetical protein